MHASEDDARLRIVDANLNRAAEGLRVAEDICRFALELSGVARELKELRHEVLAAGRPDAEALRRQIEARDAERDVGRPGAAGDALEPAAATRDDLLTRALANLSRVREALRTLEEVVRGDAPEVAARFERARYRIYSIEKALARSGRDAQTRIGACRLLLLFTEALCVGDPWHTLDAALEGGVDAVQLREKGLPDDELLRRARRLREVTLRRGALFFVNDRVDIALAAGADGVHLGQGDLPLAAARAIARPGLLIGVSTHSVEQARAAMRDGADLIGVGPAYATATKDAGPPLGAPGIADILRGADLGEVPAFVIGGVTPERLGELRAAGATRIAVSSAILGSPDPRAAAARLGE